MDFQQSGNTLNFTNIGNYVKDSGPTGSPSHTSTGSLSLGGVSVDYFSLAGDNPGNSDDFYITFNGSYNPGVLSLTGSSTLDLGTSGHNFGHLNIGTYSLEPKHGDTSLNDSGHTLVIQYSSVPDSGSTAALLGMGVAALAFVRRRLG